jgi:hypothetical protein
MAIRFPVDRAPLHRRMVTPDYERREFARVAEAMEAPNAVFVFGSNLAGRHGAGAAKVARERYGAVQGEGEGLQGRSYAIPTRAFSGGRLITLGLSAIRVYVETFSDIARRHPDVSFVVTRVGCGHARLTDRQIAPLFADAPPNCLLPIGWREMANEAGG